MVEVTAKENAASLKRAIETNDISMFKSFVYEGAVITSQHLIAATVLDSLAIVEYIVANYGVSEKAKLLDIICAQLALRDKVARTESMNLLLEFASSIIYNGTRQLTVMGWNYKQFKYILQIQNPTQDSNIKAVNKVMATNFMDLANQFEATGSDVRAFLKTMVVNLERKTPIEEPELLSENDTALSILEEQSRRYKADQELISMLEKKQKREIEELDALRSISEIPSIIPEEPTNTKNVYMSFEAEKDPLFSRVRGLRPVEDNETSKVIEKSASEFEEVCATLQQKRTVGIPGMSIEDRLMLAGITVEEVIRFVHTLEGR